MYHFLSLAVGIPKTITGSDSSLFRSFVFREMANSFGIWDTPDDVTDVSELLGFAVYPQATFFNHSCSPNVAKCRVGATLKFTTTTNVLSQTPLTIAYGNVDAPVSVRRRRLLENYFFECGCRRCVRESSE
jgi:SET and MYND domain-containing protein